MDIVGGHKTRFSISDGVLIKTTYPTEANFYARYGETLQEILPRYKQIEPLAAEAKIHFLPVGEALCPKGVVDKDLKYMDIKVGAGFSPYEATLQHPAKWGRLTDTEREQKIQKRYDKEAAYGQRARGFRVVNYSGAPEAEDQSATRLALARQSTSESFHEFFGGDVEAMLQASEKVMHIKKLLTSIPQCAALGFVSTSILFAYHPDSPGEADAKLIDFAHFLSANQYSSAQHCQETARVRAAFMLGLSKLAQALQQASALPQDMSA